MGLTKPDYANAGKQMNELMGLTPPIDCTAKVADIKEDIVNNAGEVVAKDKFDDGTWAVLSFLGVNPKDKKDKKDKDKAKDKDKDKDKGGNGKDANAEPAAATAAGPETEKDKKAAKKAEKAKKKAAKEAKAKGEEPAKEAAEPAKEAAEPAKEAKAKGEAAEPAKGDKKGGKKAKKEAAAKAAAALAKDPKADKDDKDPKKSKKKGAGTDNLIRKGEKNEYGHYLSSQAAAIDALLKAGTTMEDMVKQLAEDFKRPESKIRARVKAHMKHLEEKKGFQVKEQKNKKLKFVTK
jgi:hypothetical protein